MNRRYESLDVKNDPLVAIAAMVLWESFQPKLKAAPIKGAPSSLWKDGGGGQVNRRVWCRVSRKWVAAIKPPSVKPVAISGSLDGRPRTERSTALPKAGHHTLRR
jgi:hypothetical protein